MSEGIGGDIPKKPKSVDWEVKDLCKAIEEAGTKLSDEDFERVAREVGEQDRAAEGILRVIRRLVKRG